MDPVTHNNLDLIGFCSAHLQVGIFDPGTCPPEGGRYMIQEQATTRVLQPVLLICISPVTSVQQRTDLAHLAGKISGIVIRRIFELLK